MLKQSNQFSDDPDLCCGHYSLVNSTFCDPAEEAANITSALKFISTELQRFVQNKHTLALTESIVTTADINSDNYFFLNPLTRTATTLTIYSAEKVVRNGIEACVFSLSLNIGHQSQWLLKPVVEVDSAHWDTLAQQGIGTELIHLISQACINFDLSTELLIADRSDRIDDRTTVWSHIMDKFPELTYIEL